MYTGERYGGQLEMLNAEESVALSAQAPLVAPRSGSSPCSKAATLVCLVWAPSTKCYLHEPAKQMQGSDRSLVSRMASGVAL